MKEYDKTQLYRQCTEQIGLTPRLLTAEKDQIPADILRSIPRKLSISIQHNSIYYNTNGYGLIGTSRIGKTCANAVVIKQGINMLLTSSLEHRQNNPNDWDLVQLIEGNLERCTGSSAFKIANWVYWPECFDWLQRNAITDFGKERLPRFHPESMKTTKLLILDDLGRESFSKKSPDGTTPYAIGQLSLVINYRNEHNLPVIWTSNLEEVDLIQLYGAPMYLRLVEIAPPSEWISSC
jgi:hypothetical protein